MAVNIPDAIEFVTKAHELEPGDILAMGTNHRGLHPFQDGQPVEIETEGLGRCTSTIQDDLKRTWERQTRLSAQGSRARGPAAAAHRQVRTRELALGVTKARAWDNRPRPLFVSSLTFFTGR